MAKWMQLLVASAAMAASLIGACALPAAADTSPLPAGGWTAGRTVTEDIPASPGGFQSQWSFVYPGDNSSITFDAELYGLDPALTGAAGFRLFDVQHRTSPAQTATVLSNQRQNDPVGLEFNYSSGSAGTVILQFFSYAPHDLSLSLTQSGRVLSNANGATVPLDLESGSAWIVGHQ